MRQVIVAIPHQAEVTAVLQSLGIAVTQRDTSAELGLALIELGEGNRASRQLMRRLYAYFEAKYEGWVPTMGRNRLVSSVTGAGEISFGGAGWPQPSSPPEHWPPEHGPPQPTDGYQPKVGVLDTGVDLTALDPWLEESEGLRETGGEPWTVLDGHATFVTGLVVQRAPRVRVRVRKVLTDRPDDATPRRGKPDGSADSWTVAKAIALFGAEDFDVLNLSFTCRTRDGRPPLALATAVARVIPRTVVVAAAGNHGPGRWPAWPAALDGVVAVGAVDSHDRDSRFTPSRVPWIDICAAGVDVPSTYLTGAVRVPVDARSAQGAATFETVPFEGFATWSGTSFAAATVTGAIAARVDPNTSAQVAYTQVLEAAKRRPDGPPVLTV